MRAENKLRGMEREGDGNHRGKEKGWQGEEESERQLGKGETEATGEGPEANLFDKGRRIGGEEKGERIEGKETEGWHGWTRAPAEKDDMHMSGASTTAFRGEKGGGVPCLSAPGVEEGKLVRGDLLVLGHKEAVHVAHVREAPVRQLLPYPRLQLLHREHPVVVRVVPRQRDRLRGEASQGRGQPRRGGERGSVTNSARSSAS